METDNTTQACPYCGEHIKVGAKKCRYCNEWLEEPPFGFQMSHYGVTHSQTHSLVNPQMDSSPVAQNPNGIPSQQGNSTTIINQAAPSNSAGTAGFVLSLISLCLSWIPGVGWIVWFLGAILSFIGMFKRPRGLAVVGFIVSFIDVIILVVGVGFLLSIFS